MAEETGTLASQLRLDPAEQQAEKQILPILARPPRDAGIGGETIRIANARLSALRCFESAGRHLSFTLAADALSVTQGAVSRQIQNLEQWLGHKLFVRGHRSVTLTDAGRELLAVLTISFDEITGALDGIRNRPAGAPLAISVEPGFAACWLVPRLDRFRSQHAEIDVSIASDARLTSFRHSDVQLAIRYSASVDHWPRVDAEPLVEVAMAPVAAPALLASTRSPIRPADLRHLTLLHEENRDAWAQWFKRAGVKRMPMQRGPIFADLGIVLQAAVRGHGVALGDLFLLADEIRDGHLVQVFDIETPGGTFFLVAPTLENLSAEARAFADWLRSETALSERPASLAVRLHERDRHHAAHSPPLRPLKNQ